MNAISLLCKYLLETWSTFVAINVQLMKQCTTIKHAMNQVIAHSLTLQDTNGEKTFVTSLVLPLNVTYIGMILVSQLVILHFIESLQEKSTFVDTCVTSMKPYTSMKRVMRTVPYHINIEESLIEISVTILVLQHLILSTGTVPVLQSVNILF